MSTRAVARLLRYCSSAIQTPPPVPTAAMGVRRLGTVAGAAATVEDVDAGRGRWDLMAGREYELYRRSIYGEITHRALLVDAVGTLVVPAQPMAQVRKLVSFNADKCICSAKCCMSFSLDCNVGKLSIDLAFLFDSSLVVRDGINKKSERHPFLITHFCSHCIPKYPLDGNKVRHIILPCPIPLIGIEEQLRFFFFPINKILGCHFHVIQCLLYHVVGWREILFRLHSLENWCHLTRIHFGSK
jgi:hypothetical protein